MFSTQSHQYAYRSHGLTLSKCVQYIRQMTISRAYDTQNPALTTVEGGCVHFACIWYANPSINWMGNAIFQDRFTIKRVSNDISSEKCTFSLNNLQLVNVYDLYSSLLSEWEYFRTDSPLNVFLITFLARNILFTCIIFSQWLCVIFSFIVIRKILSARSHVSTTSGC